MTCPSRTNLFYFNFFFYSFISYFFSFRSSIEYKFFSKTNRPCDYRQCTEQQQQKAVGKLAIQIVVDCNCVAHLCCQLSLWRPAKCERLNYHELAGTMLPLHHLFEETFNSAGFSIAGLNRDGLRQSKHRQTQKKLQKK